MQKQKIEKKEQATSTELTGGTGFTYEDKVVAYYLTALLRAERAMLQEGFVCSVAVQQAGHGHPMDDLIVEFQNNDGIRTLGLQVKKTITVSGASSNRDFRDVLNRARQTRDTKKIQDNRYVYGYVVENVAETGQRALKRLIDWARSSVTALDFHRRFEKGGGAAATEVRLYKVLSPLIGAKSKEEEWNFYRQFVAERFNGLDENGFAWAEVTNRLQELVGSNIDGQEVLLFDRLCRIVRDGAGTARKWTRASLLEQLRGFVRLNVTPRLQNDIDILVQLSTDSLNEISENIDGFEVDRESLSNAVHTRLVSSRVVNISGLPGCGKSVVLKRVAVKALQIGPIFFIKSDRLTGKSWLEFSRALGLNNWKIEDILIEVGATGSAILYIDGIDRINPDQKRIILDILKAIESNPALSNWQVLATSRDQGLETYRAWFPKSFYLGTQIGDVQVNPFDDIEAEALAKEKPNLRHLLMGASSVKEIARRPFFAAVLAKTFVESATEPQTEVDLINAWWSRAGYDAASEVVPQRQRALLDIAEKGAANLGKNVAARSLASTTFDHITALKNDLLLRGNNGDSSFSFTHDIFFEWSFFRLLIDFGEKWIEELVKAGEPPLLGRVVSLLAQHSITEPNKWSDGYTLLDQSILRPQWRREWLTAPPFSSSFQNIENEFTKLMTSNDYLLFEKLLVWFQAQHTIPNPTVLAQALSGQSGLDQVALAELLSWPSDFTSWGRLIDWILQLAPSLPVRLLPTTVEVFSVWQNAFSAYSISRSEAIIFTCSGWLIDFEESVYNEGWEYNRGKWDELSHEVQKQFATALRSTILRAARAFSSPAIELFNRAVTNRRMREEAYSDLMAYAWLMAEVSPGRLVALAKAKLKEELPKDKVERLKRENQDRFIHIQRIRDKPDDERSEKEKKVLNHSYFHISNSDDNISRDNLSIDQEHNFYYPISPLHEPFASLFSKKPEFALELVCDLSNHAITAWRQIADIKKHKYGTPIPIKINFPWGEQEFWGDWKVYNWQLGQLGPNPIECAYLALSYWAFHQIDKGKSVDDVIQHVLNGNQSISALGLALRIAIEKEHISEITLALLTNQRLWPLDISRVINEPMKNIDIFGLGLNDQLTGDKKTAQNYLDERLSRSKDVKYLAMQFIVNGKPLLRQKLKQRLANFVSELPFSTEEQRSNPELKQRLIQQAEEYSAIAVDENYRGYATSNNETVVSYEPALSPEAIQRSKAASIYIQQYNTLSWAMQSLSDFSLNQKITLADATILARPLDHRKLFNVRLDTESHMPQSLVAAVAACIVCFGEVASEDYAWALDVLDRVIGMKEPAGYFDGSNIPWHPVIQVIFALMHLRRINPTELKYAKQLLSLSTNVHKNAAAFAITALLNDPDIHVTWISAQYAIESASYYSSMRKRDESSKTLLAEKAKESMYERCLKRFDLEKFESFESLPPAWIKIEPSKDEDEVQWSDPNPSLNVQSIENQLKNFPIEKWCALDELKPLVFNLIVSLVNWTILRINRPDETHKRGRLATDLISWNSSLGRLLARTVQYYDITLIKSELLEPFFNKHEDDEFSIFTSFTTSLVTRHILDAKDIPENTFDLLNLCVEHVITDKTFRLGRYRAGEIFGSDMPKAIEALLMVNVEHAPGAARFVNGDWSEIELVMPAVSKLMANAGWSTFVMSNFLLLCQRAGVHYPLDHFISQVSAALSIVTNEKGIWTGTSLPSKIAATVQRLADANYPLRIDQAQGLLKILDALIDLGDRRSATLEQSETFKGVKANTSTQ